MLPQVWLVIRSGVLTRVKRGLWIVDSQIPSARGICRADFDHPGQMIGPVDYAHRRFNPWATPASSAAVQQPALHTVETRFRGRAFQTDAK